MIKYDDKFQCDLIIWESGYIDNKGRAIISLGQKGILNVELNVKGPSRDVHSSLAMVIENPAWNLIHALSSLYDNHGKILIDGWYDEIEQLSDKEIYQLTKEFFDRGFKKEYGIDKFVNKTSGFEIKKSLA